MRLLVRLMLAGALTIAAYGCAPEPARQTHTPDLCWTPVAPGLNITLPCGVRRT